MMYKTVLIVAFVAATALSVFAAEPKIPGADDVLASGFDAVTNKPGLPIFDFVYSGQTFQPFVRVRRKRVCAITLANPTLWR